MWHRKLLSFLILVSIYCHGVVFADKLRLCVVAAKKTNRTIQKTCPQLAQPNSPVECVIETDRFNCLRRIAEYKANLTVLGPEDLITAASWTESGVLVTNELRFDPSEKYQYQVSVLIRKSVGIQRLSDVRGKRFCHPGYESTDDWTPALASFFENNLFDKECDPNKTLIENRVAAASKYFDAACMAGPWTADVQLDSKLKRRYRNLCALCDNPAGCFANDKYHGREGAFLCLTDGAGDIAWGRTDIARTHFEFQKVPKEDYSWLCRNGETRDLATEEPCFWIPKPWPVVVAHSNDNEVVSQLISPGTNPDAPWRRLVMGLLENRHIADINPENLGTPEDYLKRVPGFLEANIRPPCIPSRSIKWCVSTNIEQRKCIWLSNALSVYGVEPELSCILRPSRLECIEAARDGEVELFVINPEEELTARQKGLKRVVHLFTNKNEDINKIAAVVRSNSNIKNLRQLKGLKACFTGYRSVGWNAFVSIMKNVSGSSWYSNDAKEVSNFFKESCTLGLGIKNVTIPSNLYSLCKEGAKYGDETSAFKCLAKNGGDVAFISLDTVKRNIGSNSKEAWASGLKMSDFRPLCGNESDPNTCFFTWTTLGSVMVNGNISAVRFEEIYSTLLQVDQLFGESFTGQSPAFLVYGNYDGYRNVIFPEQTQRLQTDISHVRSGKNYNEIVEDLINSSQNSATQFRYNSFQLYIICIAICIASQILK